ncbi:hypothetical protein GLOTRDRAFT_126140 [Gloeophyllum trabeum ATCC 11539]|uniref:C2H2-type domain-containing protein n=1 Tax=Gloeophyllum trabeum (strain ATCC 11539 / FP-39264 / Madison 617) TaxID=670483 RepID=S7QJI4_GLOTA|nr:uncharacterized protein GLOTRDRAFT_126140 [Gloeophyllum trabeum ATCC 11539]EPQ59846.1 hypothetical protein GLOTRDRAFT_126140 [Gloeophyllum trabeum ATCC 11539]
MAIAKAAPSFRVAVQPPAPTTPRPEKRYRMLVAVDERNESRDAGPADVDPATEPSHGDYPSAYSRQSPGPSRGTPSGTYTYTFDLSSSSSFHPLAFSPEPDPEPASRHGPRKHTCRICLKRFNRPSSLKIHETTHTGVKPFKCHWEGCGRLFNVNSNMRRHFRNHITSQRAKAVRAASQPGTPVQFPGYGIEPLPHIRPSHHDEDEIEASLTADTGTEPESEDDHMRSEGEMEDEEGTHIPTSPCSFISSPPFHRVAFKESGTYDAQDHDENPCHAYSTSYTRAQSQPQAQSRFIWVVLRAYVARIEVWEFH